MKLTRPQLESSIPVEGIPKVVHFETWEYANYYELNLILSANNDPHDQYELDWHSREIVEYQGYDSPASVLADHSTEDMRTIYSFNFTPTLTYIPKFEVYQLRGYYVKNKITAAALSQLEDIIRGNHVSTSLFVLESEFYRTLESLELHWH